MLSFVYPIFDRNELFRTTLDTFVLQEDPGEHEIIVVDDGSTEDVLSLLAGYSQLPLHYIRIDNSRLPWPVWTYHGQNNCSAALNVGIRAARGERVALSSPEIFHQRRTNVQRLGNWRLRENQALVCDVSDLDVGMLSGGPGRRALHFLAAYGRDRLLRIGGFEEQFMRGWAFEDVEFMRRWQWTGGTFVFSGPEIQGHHQRHSRVEFADASGRAVNERLYLNATKEKPACANRGHDWGSRELIVSEWESPCSASNSQMERAPGTARESQGWLT